MSTFAELKALNALLLKDRVAIIKRHQKEMDKHQNAIESLWECTIESDRFYGTDNIRSCEICRTYGDKRDEYFNMVTDTELDTGEYICKECNDNPKVDCKGYIIKTCMNPLCEKEHLNNYSKFKDYCSFNCYLYDNFYADTEMLFEDFFDNEWGEKDRYDSVMQELRKTIIIKQFEQLDVKDQRVVVEHYKRAE